MHKVGRTEIDPIALENFLKKHKVTLQDPKV